MFKLVRDDGYTKAWEHGDPAFMVQNGKLFIIGGDVLNFMVSDETTKFYAGNCSDLKNALLSLTDKDES